MSRSAPSHHAPLLPLVVIPSSTLLTGTHALINSYTPLPDLIDKNTKEIRQDDDKTVYKTLEDIGDDLPDHSPRFILLSYPMTLVRALFYSHHLTNPVIPLLLSFLSFAPFCPFSPSPPPHHHRHHYPTRTNLP